MIVVLCSDLPIQVHGPSMQGTPLIPDVHTARSNRYHIPVWWAVQQRVSQPGTTPTSSRCSRGVINHTHKHPRKMAEWLKSHKQTVSRQTQLSSLLETHIPSSASHTRSVIIHMNLNFLGRNRDATQNRFKKTQIISPPEGISDKGIELKRQRKFKNSKSLCVGKG